MQELPWCKYIFFNWITETSDIELNQQWTDINWIIIDYYCPFIAALHQNYFFCITESLFSYLSL